MAVRITTQENMHALYDSVTGWAFGPVFDRIDDAQQFLAWAQDESGLVDLRIMSDRALEEAYARFRELAPRVES
jgi:hypothetical protein